MLEYMRFFLIVLFATGLGYGQEYNCVDQSYSSYGKLQYTCRKGCIGVAPDCVPDCLNKCPEHSKCVSPETCECDVGYIANETDKSILPNLKSCKSALEIKCPPNSRNANDTTCICVEGYEVNTTDFNKLPSLQSCRPICEQGCPVHSQCTSPNKCECDLDYVPEQTQNDTIPNLENCIPICDPECPANGFCASPYVCKCRQGYSSIENKSGDVESCFDDHFNGLHIVIYSLLICSMIFTMIALIAMITIRLRKNKVDVPRGIPETTSWRTSFASYTEYEMK